MANELFHVIDPYLKAHQGPLTLAGHSLGGTLAKLLSARVVIEGRVRPDDVFCHTFGSPAAFSTRCGGRGTAVMRRLGLHDSQIRNWILDHDPIPRAWTEANPYLQMVLQVQALKSVYEWTEWAAKAIGTTPVLQRLFFRNVGDVFLLTRDAAAADGIRHIEPEDIEAELGRRPAPTAASAPFPGPLVVRQLQQMLEHSHRSYTHDLLVAARLRQRREEDSAAADAAAAGTLAPAGDGAAVADGNDAEQLSASAQLGGVRAGSNGAGLNGARLNGSASNGGVAPVESGGR